MDVERNIKTGLTETEVYLCLLRGFLILRNRVTLAVAIPEGTWAVEKSLPSLLSCGSRLEETLSGICLSKRNRVTHVKSAPHVSEAQLF